MLRPSSFLSVLEVYLRLLAHRSETPKTRAMSHPKPLTITNEQRQQIQQLRQELKGELPPDLDTELNLYRWIHGWSGNIREASQRFRTYIENRRAFHLDHAEFPDQFLSHPALLKYGLYFSFSLLPEAINPYDDSVVVVQKMENIDFHRMAKIMTCENFVALYFVVCERVFREILKKERETGRKSGLTIIYDLGNFPLWSYVNPNAPIHKIHKLCLHLLQDYYCDMLHRVYLVNAPTVLTIVLEIVKKFLNPMTQEKLVIIPDKETLLKNAHPSVVPVFYGGNYKLTDEQVKKYAQLGFNLNSETCALVPRTVTDADHFVPRQFPVAMVTEHLKPKQKFEVELKTGKKKGSKLHWQFWVNSEVHFAVLRVGESKHVGASDSHSSQKAFFSDGQRSLVFPRFILNTPKLPEEGYIVCDEGPATYVLEFANHSTSWFSLKLEYAAYVEDVI